MMTSFTQSISNSFYLLKIAWTLATKYFATRSTMMFSSNKRFKLFSTKKALVYLGIINPVLLFNKLIKGYLKIISFLHKFMKYCIIDNKFVKFDNKIIYQLVFPIHLVLIVLINLLTSFIDYFLIGISVLCLVSLIYGKILLSLFFLIYLLFIFKIN